MNEKEIKLLEAIHVYLCTCGYGGKNETAAKRHIKALSTLLNKHFPRPKIILEEKKVWSGPQPTHCDMCSKPLHKTFIDGKTKDGPWGILCTGCHALDGVGLGEGRGQKYDL